MTETPNTLPWTWDRSERVPKLVLIDQDQLHRATLITSMDKGGLLFYCEVVPNIHDPVVETSRGRSPTAAMLEAESLLVEAGVEI